MIFRKALRKTLALLHFYFCKFFHFRPLAAPTACERGTDGSHCILAETFRQGCNSVVNKSNNLVIGPRENCSRGLRLVSLFTRASPGIMAFARLCWAPVELNLRPGPLTFTKRATRLPSRDEARRIAVNIAPELQELLRPGRLKSNTMAAYDRRSMYRVSIIPPNKTKNTARSA